MFYSIKAKLAAAMFTGAALAGCVNDGTVADKHAITFEQRLPELHPSQSELESAVRAWLVNTTHDGGTAKDVTVGPVRFAKVILIPPQGDFFSCVQFTAKNQYGVYMPPSRVLTTFRNYNNGRGYVVSLVKQPGTGAYDQYCISQPHG